ncbi:MAG: hypothetical protein RR893_12370 [Clostridia bacterium]
MEKMQPLARAGFIRRLLKFTRGEKSSILSIVFGEKAFNLWSNLLYYRRDARGRVGLRWGAGAFGVARDAGDTACGDLSGLG